MASSFLLVHCAPRTALSCVRTYHPYDVKSCSFSLLTFPRHLDTSGIEVSSPSRRGSVLQGDSSGSFRRRLPNLCGSSRPSHGVFQWRNLLLRCDVGIADGTRRYVITTASTKEREWQDYEDALRHKDLARALEVLDVLNSCQPVAGSLPAAGIASSTSTPDFLEALKTARSHVRPQILDDLKILDACLMTSDLAQVGKAYEWLRAKGFLPNFGKGKVIACEGDQLVTEAILMDSIGLNASKLSPKKWGLSGESAIALPMGIALFSYVRDSGVDVRPIAALILGLSLYDAIYLGGTGLVQIFSMWLPYKRRVLVHEAGHILVAYLMGCPIRGVILDPVQALKMGIRGQTFQFYGYKTMHPQRRDSRSCGYFSEPDLRYLSCRMKAGTQFWDQTLEMQFSQTGMASLTVDRYSIVLFAGIAAEALIYGEAQGGESDENLFKSVVGQLRPSWSPAKMADHARWAVLQAFQLLRNHKKAHAAVVQALEQEAGLGSTVRAIEDAMP